MASKAALALALTVMVVLVPITNLLRNFISFYHQAYRVAVWHSRHDFVYLSAD
jgi:hypothetical protein